MKTLIDEYEKKHDIKILYLVKFGSHLYGTNTKTSDSDYKGLFLPSKQSCYLNKQQKNINFTSGKQYLKNSKDDIDIGFWSIQYWFELLKKGDTNALDLLYSSNYPDMIEYQDDILLDIWNNQHLMFDIDECKGYIGYIKRQVAKYGLKGERVGVYKSIIQLYSKCVIDDDQKLNVISDYIIEHCYNSSYCFLKNIDDVDYLIICGKLHQLNIKMSEFKKRINNEYKKYGHRAILADKNKGIDWKAVSHAVRALYQMSELIDNGYIQFPLNDSKYIKQIKLGQKKWNEVSDFILNFLNEVDRKMCSCIDHKCERDDSFINKFIISLYESK